MHVFDQARHKQTVNPTEKIKQKKPGIATISKK